MMLNVLGEIITNAGYVLIGVAVLCTFGAVMIGGDEKRTFNYIGGTGALLLLVGWAVTP